MKFARMGLVVGLTMVVGIGAAVALAASNTSVTIKSHDSDAFLDGKVISSRPSCEGGRLVKLYWDEPGSPQEYDGIATADSKPNGKWKVEAPGEDVPPGHYYAKVPKDGSCDKAKSDTITVHL